MSKFFRQSAMVAIACASIGMVHANEDMPLTRSQVVAQLDSARASGELNALCGEDSGSFWLSSPGQSSGTTRQWAWAASEAPYVGRNAAPMHGEDSGSMYLSAAPFTSKLTRTEVSAEVQRARVNGELTAMVGEDSGSVQLSRQSTERSVLYVGPNVRTGNDAASASVASVN